MQSQSKTKLSQLVTHVAIPRRFPVFGVQPARHLFGAQPRELTLRELARCENAALLGLLQRVLSVEVSPELPVTHRPHGRMSGRQVAALVQPPDFVQKTR